MGIFGDGNPDQIFGGDCCCDDETDPSPIDPVQCFANLTLPVPPGVVAGTRFIVTNVSGSIHPSWINLPSGLEENDIIEKDFQNLNWLLSLDVSEVTNAGVIVYIECKCFNYWYDACNSEWKEISLCGFVKEYIDEDLTVTTDGQTIFTLSQIPDAPNKAVLTVNGVDYLYGIEYTLSGTTLTWLNKDFELEECDIVHIRYC